MRAIPPEQYANRAEVARSVPVDVAAEAAREQHRHGQRHLPQYLREVPKPPVEEELENPPADDELDG